jgi:hypothetical protein
MINDEHRLEYIVGIFVVGIFAAVIVIMVVLMVIVGLLSSDHHLIAWLARDIQKDWMP